jgi:hypothetical protein
MEGYCILYTNYFVDDPMHGEVVFRCYFRMIQMISLKIVYDLWDCDTYFIFKNNCICNVGFFLLQKCIFALRMFAYGAPGNAQYDYICMVDSMTMECMYRFCKAVVEVFGPTYLRTPIEEDTTRILAQNEARAFCGMVGSIDYMY